MAERAEHSGEPTARDGHPADPEAHESDGHKPDEFERFEDLARRLVQVPKSELDDKLKKS